MKQPLLIIVVAIIVFAGLYFIFNSNNDMENETVTPAVQNQQEEIITPTAEGKLDINAVCEGALAYMTFTDGASADAFVADCKEGKHPEVILRYQQEMNLGEGAEI